ncbi:SDR family NAD(P)-dependent oxidoreductase [Portibacter lacus]|uniref:Short chain dehydrogenase n=1 Tax=Portibacter lacus TaxID=1099794 RepID=A0AA37SQ36_9BACT|nr:SDR family NAD(P)-dependent oxidoreductase [Portibacter lacus]GLR18758.1 short chain dehydrogenase [Portibacter lacus]
MENTKKTAVITGAASGLGLAMANAFAEEGYQLVLADINETGLEKVKNTLGENVITSRVDVSNYEQVEGLINLAVGQFGSVDVMINNAGIGPRNLVPVAEYSFKDWDDVIAVNQTGVFYGMKAALIQMLKQGQGNIINVASLAGLKASPNNISYAASKFAVVGMTKSAAMEYGRKKIRINAICPGYSHSALLDKMFKFKPELEDGLKNLIPFRRYGEASEIADAAIWLASDKSSYMTGQCLTLDGGLSL